MTRKSKRIVVYTGIATVLTGLLALALRPAALEVETARVERGPLAVSVEEQGRTRARYRYTVAAPVSGRLLRTRYDAGDRAEAGAVLARITPPPENVRVAAMARAQLVAARARQREARAKLEETQRMLERAQLEAKRRAELFAKGLVSRETLDLYTQTADAAKDRVDSARAALGAARAVVASAESRLLGIDETGSEAETVAVRAPVTGMVLRVHEQSERVVAAGTPLFELSDGTALELLIDVRTQDAVRIEPGDPITISGWGGAHPLRGRVRYVEPDAFTKISTLGVEEQRVNVVGDLLEPAAGLGSGYRIDAAIEVWAADRVLRVPSSAIFRRRGAWHAFVAVDGRARLRPLTIGRRSVDYAQVLDGLGPGEAVIVFPSDKVDDGVRISAVVR